MDEFIPGFRAHIALSVKHDEVIIAAESKSPNSPYPEINASYSWHDFVPVSVSALNNNYGFLGQRVKAVLLLSKLHYKAPEITTLKKEYEARKEYLSGVFGQPDSRLLHGKFVVGSYAYMASVASDMETFSSDYLHIVVEDGSGTQLKICRIYELLNQATKTSILKPSVLIDWDCQDDVLWKSIIDLLP